MNTSNDRLLAALMKAGEDPIEMRADPVHMALLGNEMDELLRLVGLAQSPDDALRRVHHLAQTAVTRQPIGGSTMRAELVAWPFLLNFGRRGGRVPAQFDMGAAEEASGKRMGELWKEVLSATPGALVVPLRLGVHAHTVYGVNPHAVQQVVSAVARVIGQDGARIPRGVAPVENDSPRQAAGALYAPVLAQAVILTPEDEPLRFARAPRAMETARQLLASKLGLTSITPTVMPLQPAPFFEALQHTLQIETVSMALWEGGDEVRTKFTLSWASKDTKVMKRELTMQPNSAGGVFEYQDSFDLRWIPRDALRTAVSQVAKVAGSQETRRFFLNNAQSWSDPSRLN